MNLIRETWQELWQRNRGGGLLTLAFWYTMLTALYQYLVFSRLGPSLPASLQKLLSHPGAISSFPHLSHALWIKLALVYVTFLVVILPYAVGGLYGGIASALRERPQRTGFLAFFRFGYLHFWQALGQLLLAIVYGVVLLLAMTGVFVVLTLVGGNNPIVAVILVILAVLVMLWLVGTLLYWFGFTFGTGQSPLKGWLPALRWGFGHLRLLYGRMALLVGLLLATLLVFEFLAAGIPIIGPVLWILVMGMIVPAFLATYALLFYQTAAED
ncbi:MAG: hypothetical protein OWU84_04605 [Firmicutes bacterium]|nr:hypothetical protein [Bacillota bacterium]